MSSKEENPFYPPVPEAVVAQAKYAIIGGLSVYIYTPSRFTYVQYVNTMFSKLLTSL
jgi:hypothetical protein